LVIAIVLDEKTMLANAFIFFLAGFETTASTLSYCLFELSRNPEIQEKLYREVKRVLDSHQGDINYDILKEIGYLDQVINGKLLVFLFILVLLTDDGLYMEI
jgi:cytochrome P450 family 6